MKNTQLLFCIALLLSITINSCGPDEPATPNNIYESCCGAEPVEFTIPDESVYAYIPNAFTPNNDGSNDIFRPLFNNQIQTINSFVIESESGNGTLFQVENMDIADVLSYSWDGYNSKGVPQKGAFKYAIVFTTKSGAQHTITGRGCSIVCDTDAAIFKDKTGCFYPSQYDLSGHLDSTLLVGPPCL